jgi:hypothetical protein
VIKKGIQLNKRKLVNSILYADDHILMLPTMNRRTQQCIYITSSPIHTDSIGQHVSI